MVALLYKKENITGDEVRDIIIDFEDRNGIETKVDSIVDEIKEELKEDAEMVKDSPADDK